MFDTGALDGFKGAVASLGLFFSFFVAQVLVGSRKQFINKLFFSLGTVLLVLIIIILVRKFVPIYPSLISDGKRNCLSL